MNIRVIYEQLITESNEEIIDDHIFGKMTKSSTNCLTSVHPVFKNAKVLFYAPIEQKHYDLFNIIKNNYNKMIIGADKIHKILDWIKTTKIYKNQYKHIKSNELPDILILDSIWLYAKENRGSHIELKFYFNIDKRKEYYCILYFDDKGNSQDDGISLANLE